MAADRNPPLCEEGATMNAHKGYYSVVQYCPDRSRLEAANIGVLLFCPELGYLCARTSRDNARIRRFFRSEGHDWERINSFKQGIEERLDAERPNIRTLEDLERFITTRGNEFQITVPRTLKVREPDTDIAELFEELVGGEHHRARGANLRRILEKKFSTAGVERKIEKEITVNVPIFNRDVQVPYAFQNGRLHLIRPVRFEGRDIARAMNTACKYAVEGESLYNSPDPRLGKLQLVVVGGFHAKQGQAQEDVRRILEEHTVQLFGISDLPKLIEEIRQTAKDIVD
jgi:hypothetical protein